MGDSQGLPWQGQELHQDSTPAGRKGAAACLQRQEGQERGHTFAVDPARERSSSRAWGESAVDLAWLCGVQQLYASLLHQSAL
jgi:hypothetical protein